ncbi:hypothetical protein I9R28_04115, partial [Campylobacter jejuni]|nr:hypothetical protein [Campylobacter jejuni]
MKKERYMILEYSYFLSEQGHVFLHAGGKEISLSDLNFLHELFISKIGVILLRDTEYLELNDIYTEKDQFDEEENFFKGSSKAFPDLYIPKYNVIIEYERTD